MIKVVTNNKTLIIKFKSNCYLIHFDFTQLDNSSYSCCEDNIFVLKNTKQNLYQAIIDYKYSASQIIDILTNNIDEANRSEYLEYIAWKDYAEKCASIIFDAPTLENAIKAKLEEITKYDVSSAVNGFYYQGNEYWLDKATRVGLMNSTRILKENGQTSTTLWFNDMCLTLPVDDIIDKLSALEQYALSCYNVTASHKIAVQALTTIDEVNEYDVTQGYPTKLDLS